MSLKKIQKNKKSRAGDLLVVIIRVASLGAKKSSCRAMPGAVVQVAREQITFAKKPVIRLMWSAVTRSQKA